MESLLSFFIANAYAEAAPNATPVGGGYSFIIMFVVFFLFIYFAIWRPQNKRAKEQQQLLSSLAKDEEIVIAGGLLGRITKIAEPYVIVNLATGVDVIVQKTSVVSVLPKGTLKSID